MFWKKYFKPYKWQGILGFFFKLVEAFDVCFSFSWLWVSHHLSILCLFDIPGNGNVDA